MNSEQIRKLIEQGEGVDIEFKTCRTELNRNVYETVCAFLNRHGGTVLLGVTDAGEISGVDPDKTEQIKKDFVNSLNNPQKINPACYLSLEDILIENKTVLHVFVPESSLVHRCSGRIYDRNEDGDFDITDHTGLVSDLYHRKQATYTENKIYPFAELSDMRSELIEKSRKHAGIWRDDHPWLEMDDLELLKSAQLYQTDPETGKSGITLAGILLFGTDRLILTAVPHHRTDLILRKVNLDRYDDRDLVRTNLIESYERIMAFIKKHLPDPYYMEGIERISIRDTIFREVASNILIHREYTNAFPAKLIIERGQVRTENSNKPHGFGILDPTNFTPYPKNPVISAFFREIHSADELGSGMRKMMKYGKAYGGGDPEMSEGDVFKIVVKVPEFGESGGGSDKCPTTTQQVTGEAASEGVESGVESGVELGVESDMALQIISYLQEAPLAKSKIAKKLGKAKPTRYLNDLMSKLLHSGHVEYTIPDKPTSSRQKYRLTDKGRAFLASLEKGNNR